MARTPSNLPDLLPGWVWLVGAGPGDPGLLTLHALQALQQADVIVYDALVSDEVLELAGDSAQLIYAGKRGGKPSAAQRDISLKLVDLARDSKRVCRLKGGDPFIFGRGGEEALTLVEHDIPFRVVPGISAGIGGLAYAGIPATHRETNHCVTFLTGHDSGGLVPDAIDWESIARGSPVIVMYMAMKHIHSISEKLMQAGRSPDEPVAFITNVTCSQMQVHETRLGEIGDLDALGLVPPAMIVVGEVVRFRSALDWLGAMSGRKLQKDPLGYRHISRSA